MSFVPLVQLIALGLIVWVVWDIARTLFPPNRHADVDALARKRARELSE